MADSSTKRSGTNNSNRKEIYVKEELKIAVKLSLEKFRYDEEQKGQSFESFESSFVAIVHLPIEFHFAALNLLFWCRILISVHKHAYRTRRFVE